jgi:hypothetical protein
MVASLVHLRTLKHNTLTAEGWIESFANFAIPLRPYAVKDFDRKGRKGYRKGRK